MESKTLIKHISCECKCKFDDSKSNANQKWNNDKCWCECKNPEKHQTSKKDYIWNPSTCSCENSGYAGSINGDLLIRCDEIIDTADSVSTNVSCSVPLTAASTASIHFDKDSRILEQLLHFTHGLTSAYVTIYNRYYLPPSYKT